MVESTNACLQRSRTFFRRNLLFLVFASLRVSVSVDRLTLLCEVHPKIFDLEFSQEFGQEKSVFEQKMADEKNGESKFGFKDQAKAEETLEILAEMDLQYQKLTVRGLLSRAKRVLTCKYRQLFYSLRYDMR